jgi:hypothetical protein
MSSNYDELLSQLAAELRTRLSSKVTAEQIGETAEALIAMGEPIDLSLLKSVGTVILHDSQAFAFADPNLLNAIVLKARDAKVQDRIRATLGQA